MIGSFLSFILFCIIIGLGLALGVIITWSIIILFIKFFDEFIGF